MKSTEWSRNPCMETSVGPVLVWGPGLGTDRALGAPCGQVLTRLKCQRNSVMRGPHPLVRPFRSFTRSSVTVEEKSHHVSSAGRKKWVFWSVSRALSSYWCVPFRETTSWETTIWETGNSHPPRRVEGLGSPDMVPVQGRKLSMAETSHTEHDPSVYWAPLPRTACPLSTWKLQAYRRAETQCEEQAKNGRAGTDVGIIRPGI